MSVQNRKVKTLFKVKIINRKEFNSILNSVEIKFKAKIISQSYDIEVHGTFPSMDHLKDNIYEFRFQYSSNIVRILWTYDKSRQRVILINHAFIKKTQSTPKCEIQRAKKVLERYYKESIWS